jgi:AcrR family transcriptional regulator
LYKHFASKEELLRAGVERHVRELDSVTDVVSLLPLSDLRSELTLLVRWLLLELDRERDLHRVLEKEGDQFPDLVELMWSNVVRRGYQHATEIARRRLKALPDAEAIDVEALAAFAVGGIVNYRRNQWTFGHTPLEVDEDRLIAVFVELFVRLEGAATHG